MGSHQPCQTSSVQAIIAGMKYLACPATDHVSIEQAERPAISPGDVLVRMLACGVCGTDLMKVYDPTVAKPVQLGHEVVGEVVEVGANVSRFKAGQRVAVAHHAPDYGSHYTRRGSATQDPAFKTTNIYPGGFAELIRVPSDLVPHTMFAVPEDMSTERAAFMEPLACCLRALDRVPVVEGDTVLVVGVGAIGLLFLPLLRDRSALVVAADVRTERLDLAAQWGAASCYTVGRDDIVAGTKAMSQGRGADLVILTAVNPATLELAMNAVRDGGHIIPFGVKPGMMPPVDLWQMYRREISIVTSYSATPDGLARSLAILSKPDFALENTISHRFTLEDAPRGFDLLHKAQASKVVIVAA